jgi:steroid delta-isomerase-like uncharacterized protein
MSDANQRLAERVWADYFNRRDLTVLDELFAPDVVNHGLRGEPQGHEALHEVLQILERGFPDFRMEVLETQVSGDRVFQRTIFCGTHKGEFYGLAPTGRMVREPQMHLFRIDDGRIAEIWAVRHELDTVRALGGRIVPG